METLEAKHQKLKEQLAGTEKALVAYSGGVDSTFLLYAARQALGRERVLAVIARSPTYPEDEIKSAVEVADSLDAEYRVIDTEEFSDENFIANPKERCYYCKKELFSKLRTVARENGIADVLDGSNVDDLSDFRPGSCAKAEFSVRSPLQEAGLTKSDIRRLSKEADLPTWDKPAMACLASRIPYGTRINEDVLKRVGEGEGFLKSLGFKQLRVRHHAPIARIEVDRDSVAKIMLPGMMEAIVKKFEELGYVYVTLDMKGYRAGSMNEG
ncbi:ATP-dependent sacrificial sulfur transferase LarE [Candidatus Saganbacteria bacterium]|uniref:ATP-dependent sacrificial sulfur transferase LarE n=1 Tax=Candidatus Saganbacteria bacterium TaxID=2575572 RepID=A0A9D6YT18_UNCSA|nr:ATP-dependent sacrificial sulfur transferase LarE [Candidatus Saganbacteria bacterium]